VSTVEKREPKRARGAGPVGHGSAHANPFALCLTLSSLFAATGCASAVESSKMEDRARRAVPVAICLKPLARHGAEGVVSTLQPEDYWQLILPTFDSGSGTIDRSSPDCAGRPVFENPELAEAEGPRTGTIKVSLDDAVVTPAADGMRIVWLRTHKFSDATAAGPIALVRPREGYGEVYATGYYRGRAADSHFSLERMGPRLLVTASDEGCTGVKPNQNCESDFAAFIMARGQLAQSARFALDRIEYRAMGGGTAQVRLTATPVFQEQALRVSEQVVVKDATQGVIRKADLERVFQLRSDGTLSPTAPSLWDQVTGAASPSSAQAPAPEEPRDRSDRRRNSAPKDNGPRLPSMPSPPTSLPSAPSAPNLKPF
jgi:hypothetical protein